MELLQFGHHQKCIKYMAPFKVISIEYNKFMPTISQLSKRLWNAIFDTALSPFSDFCLIFSKVAICCTYMVVISRGKTQKRKSDSRIYLMYHIMYNVSYNILWCLRKLVHYHGLNSIHRVVFSKYHYAIKVKCPNTTPRWQLIKLVKIHWTQYHDNHTQNR